MDILHFCSKFAYQERVIDCISVFCSRSPARSQLATWPVSSWQVLAFTPPFFQDQLSIISATVFVIMILKETSLRNLLVLILQNIFERFFLAFLDGAPTFITYDLTRVGLWISSLFGLLLCKYLLRAIEAEWNVYLHFLLCFDTLQYNFAKYFLLVKHHTVGLRNAQWTSIL